VSVDNFGTGNSSLNNIRKLPVNALKIDRAFVRLITVPGKTAAVAAFIGMARSLHLRVIAQGVETTQDLEFLWAHECDEAQGNFFSRPVPPDQLTRLLRPN
jgi:EAL domain-containing protein (putative c-di-GMP-specific phosphodiesterase class I)